MYACNKFQIMINNNFNHFNHPTIFLWLQLHSAAAGCWNPSQPSRGEGGLDKSPVYRREANKHFALTPTGTFARWQSMHLHLFNHFCESRRARRRERRRASLIRTCRTLCGSWADSRARGSGGPPGCCSRSRPGSSCGILWCTRRCLKHNVNAAGVHLQLLQGRRRETWVKTARVKFQEKKSQIFWLQWNLRACATTETSLTSSKSCLGKEFIWAWLLLWTLWRIQ